MKRNREKTYRMEKEKIRQKGERGREKEELSKSTHTRRQSHVKYQKK